MAVTYLDNNATTMLASEALAAMMPYLTDLYGNASSIHQLGQGSRHAIDTARLQVANLIGASDSEICFTGGGTEAINTAIRGLLVARAPRRKIVTTTVEHSATRELCLHLVTEGAEVVAIPVDHSGRLDLDAFVSAIDDSTALVTIMWANNETGVLFAAPEIARICRERGVPMHCDATQAAGKIPIDLKKAGFDAMSIAAHKVHGPKGVGALYIRRGLRLRPLVIGGTQERSRRAGTENVPGIVGMGKAAELAAEHLPAMPRVAAYRDRLEQRILSTIGETSINGCTDPGCRLPNTTNIGFAGLEADFVVRRLSEAGICVSVAAACSSGSLEYSHVLKAMNIDHRIARGSIRFSLSRYTGDGDINKTLAILPTIIARLRAVPSVKA